MSIIRNITDNNFKEIIKNSLSYSECLRKLGLTTTGGTSSKILKERIKELEIDTTHFQPFKNSSFNFQYTIEEILTRDSPYKSNSSLKKRILKENILEEVCSICLLQPIWNNSKLVLQLDHINGDNTDNRIENLRFLCPNCHSQTETYSGKNKQKKLKTKKERPTKIVWPSIAEMSVLVYSKPIKDLAKDLGVSDVAISKFCKKHNITKPKQGYWLKNATVNTNDLK